MQKAGKSKILRPLQKQARPGSEHKMKPVPIFDYPDIKGNNKLINKIALITGGDSGIGRAVAVLFAKEGADIAISFLSESKDANETKRVVEDIYGRTCLLIKGDIGNEKNASIAVERTIRKFGRLNILVNNAAIHYDNKSIGDITAKELFNTFHSDFFSYFFITKAAVKYMKKGDCIINTSSVTAYRGSPELIDYSAAKGAIVSFTRSLSSNLLKKGIRVNGVAPGPIWTPLIPASFNKKKVAKHGSDSPMKRAGQPVEIAPSYLFLACDDSKYISGQFIHPNGGEIVNG
jgi:NAD(P)-dependent dehydrogenase (short-subunit alcohol dehydrogenase family)